MGDGAVRIPCGWAGPSASGEPGHLADWVDASERRRAAGFGSAARQREFLLGRALVRRVLHEGFGLEPRGLTLDADDRGRLRITAPAGSGLSVCVSHSRGVVAAAATDAGSLGFDLERVRSVTRAASIARRFFTEPERRQLARLEGVALERHFLALWTLKECHLKATGEGLAGGLRGFGFEVDADGRARALAAGGEDTSGWSFRSVALGPDCVGALGLRAGGLDLELAATELRFAPSDPGEGRLPSD